MGAVPKPASRNQARTRREARACAGDDTLVHAGDAAGRAAAAPTASGTLLATRGHRGARVGTAGQVISA